ncbi:DNA gyrase subunit A [Prolixibacter denitrificans]|uniref:DNA gyrase subunit A n=1 Tax=Prolixibacter denitrificans TaxID=1541063 RepID=A0A2P8CAG7_9BACT|nr:DNA gyrase subunit A [Prolixibacter denitrificans]PSK81964.1 DNA gyrase subunit A [Prolixibacter denitrificans]GET22561.1 DNA gyrase subunit A [Prolixibacter denitrificans]
MADGEKIIKINIEEQMKSAYIDYSMSVIVSRALPDVRDGLKPVHRRILFGMGELGIYSNRSYKKSARIVGEVLGKYHPHGDSSVYFAMVRMAQQWSMRYRLVDGQGNFGSVDGDSPAAMRYTEARLQKLAEEALADLDKNTVDFAPNFDESLKEPTVLPAKFPNLLVNGASGIAVGMATNMPPHNLTDTIEAINAYIDNPDIEMDELIDLIKAPDFPTGGIIYGYSGVREAYETGRGRIVMRGKSEIEVAPNGREKLIITEIPYLVNKAELIIKIADLVNEKRIDGIANVNDESDRKGMRIVVDIKRDDMASVVLNKLYKYTQLQSTFSVNNIALVKGRPRMLNLRDLIHYFVEHRHEVVVRRTQYELDQAEKKAHVLRGLIIAIDNLDAVISLIRGSKTPEEAREGLMTNFELDEIQARAILDMRLQKLTGLERDKLHEEYDELMKQIEHLKDILANEPLRMQIIKDELAEIQSRYGDERKTEIIHSAEEFNPEDFYADDEMVITISHMGYMKRTPLTEFRTQSRGGVGSRGSTTRDEDFLEHMFIATMHNTILLFTEKGKCFWLKVYEIPEGAKASKGRAIQNLLNIEPDDNVKAFINVKNLKDEEYINNNYIILCTKKGVIKKTSLEAYSRPRQNGVNAITIRENDQLLEARLTNGNHEIMMAVRTGKAIRFPEDKVRAIGRTGAGVRGITLGGENDELVGMVCVENESEDILVVSENGFGKRSKIDDYRITNRGGKGVKTLNVTPKTGSLVAIKSASNDDDLMIITQTGVTIRVPVEDIRMTGRAAQGVKLINLKDTDKIASVARVKASETEIEASDDVLEADNESNDEVSE